MTNIALHFLCGIKAHIIAAEALYFLPFSFRSLPPSAPFLRSAMLLLAV